VRMARPSAKRLGENLQGLSAVEVSLLAGQPLIPHYLAEAFITMPKQR